VENKLQAEGVGELEPKVHIKSFTYKRGSKEKVECATKSERDKVKVHASKDLEREKRYIYLSARQMKV
jgi:hypothetical protein